MGLEKTQLVRTVKVLQKKDPCHEKQPSQLKKTLNRIRGKE
jgi:hypothetical protein